MFPKLLLVALMIYMVAGNTLCRLDNLIISTQDQQIANLPNCSNPEVVLFCHGMISYLPTILIGKTAALIKAFGLRETNTIALTQSFFGSHVYYLKAFSSYRNALSIDADAFINLGNLEDLILVKNSISSIPENAFQGLTKLRLLDLSGNHLTKVFSSWFPNDLLWLHEIYLDNNRIQDIQKGSFDLLPDLKVLSLTGNLCTKKFFTNHTIQQISQEISHCYPCRIPFIKYGKIIDIDDKSTILELNEEYSGISLLKVQCPKGMYLITDRADQNENWCVKGEWKEKWPSCQNLCSFGKISHISIEPFCKLQGRSFHCSGNIFVDSIAIIYCKIGYAEPENLDNTPIKCLENGQWSRAPHTCKAVCGSQMQSMTNEEDPNNTSKVPWNIGIYKDQNLVCGGTLISEKVIVTAAHCFTSEVQSIIDPAPYKAGAGKYHSDFKTVDDPEGQMMQVSEIQVPRRYKGPGKTGDIATVIIEGNFVLAPNIVPACFVFDNHGPMYPNNNTIALVSGWSGSQESKVLQSSIMQIIDREHCENVSYAEDKICARLADNKKKDICAGSLGSGLLVPQFENDRKRYHLQGVVTKFDSGPCDKRTYKVQFQNVHNFKQFIQSAISRSIAKTKEQIKA